AIVWQDRRTSAICEQLKTQKLEPLIQSETGLLLDPYFSGTKIKWAIENWDDVKSAYNQHKLNAGTIDTYLIARLTSGESFVTDPSNASRTLAMNLRRGSWDSDLCKLLGISRDILPEILPSAGEFGRTKGLSFLPDGIPIMGVLGDQQSALLGQACIDAGTAKCTYGTGAFLLMNTGSEPVFSQHRLLTSVAWNLGKHGTQYMLEGSTFVAGAAVQWLRDGLGFIENSADIEALASQVKDSNGVVFVPALTGLGAPHWKADATGMFTGLSRGVNRSHMARAVLEGIAFQVTDVLKAMEKDVGAPVKALHVDGGAAANGLLMQIQADFLQTVLRRPKILETTSLGAVFAAGLGIGLWSSPEDIRKSWKLDREFKPHQSSSEAGLQYQAWTKAVSRVMV
ncbi:MAG: glycerol kinase GlpK, partial [Proteobacteria bacterium]